ncbi:hypothetical protein JTB14_019834 [Gonioctena quinquepunctata]|nr:hypothetical protein JTB14_019834 [Gonioctena quinquepunctata]
MKEPSIPKDVFSRLLNKLCHAIEDNLEKNRPFDRSLVLSMVPKEQLQNVTETIENSVTDLLRQMRYGVDPKARQTRKKCNIAAGRSVAVSDATTDHSEDEIELDDELADSTVNEELEDENTLPNIVTKFGKTFDNIFPVSESEVAVTGWW